MDEINLYERILEVKAPWFVEAVELDEGTDTVTVFVACDEYTRLSCPQCGESSPRYDKRQRRWRHLDTCQFQTYVVAEVPRVQCAQHGCLSIGVSWAEQRSRFTQLFEHYVIERLLDASVNAVRKHLKLSWNAVDGIMQRAVTRGLARRKRRRLSRIGVDETSFRKHHDYVTVITDGSGCVVDVQPGKDKASLKAFYDQLSVRQKESLNVISMDMSAAYISITNEEIPGAQDKIAFDRFHVAMVLNKAVDAVRKAERRELPQDIYKQHNVSRFAWLRRGASLNGTQRQALSELRRIALKTARAWAIKEYAASLWNYRTRGWAEKAWFRWYSWAIRSRLVPIKNAAKMVKKHLTGILNAIVFNADNSMAESVNSKIKILKIKARGFRNKDRFKTAILFHYGGLDMQHD